MRSNQDYTNSEKIDSDNFLIATNCFSIAELPTSHPKKLLLPKWF